MLKASTNPFFVWATDGEPKVMKILNKSCFFNLTDIRKFSHRRTERFRKTSWQTSQPSGHTSQGAGVKNVVRNPSSGKEMDGQKEESKRILTTLPAPSGFHKLPFRCHAPNLLERALPHHKWHDKIDKRWNDMTWYDEITGNLSTRDLETRLRHLSFRTTFTSGSRTKLIDGLWGFFFDTVKTHRLSKKFYSTKRHQNFYKTHRVQHFEQGSTREHNTQNGWSQGSTFSNSSCTWGRVQSQRFAEMGQSLKTQQSLSWKVYLKKKTNPKIQHMRWDELMHFVLIVWVSMSQCQLFELFRPSRLTMKALFLWCLSWLIFNSL